MVSSIHIIVKINPGAMSDSNLCDTCDRLDLSPLVAPLPDDTGYPRRPASEYEEELAVYFEDFSLEKALARSTCALCGLLAQCAIRAGQETRLQLVNCCIRPKLVWSAEPDGAPGKRPEQKTRLCRSGQIHVWFHNLKPDIKNARSKREPRSQGKNTQAWFHKLKSPNLARRRNDISKRFALSRRPDYPPLPSEAERPSGFERAHIPEVEESAGSELHRTSSSEAEGSSTSELEEDASLGSERRNLSQRVLGLMVNDRNTVRLTVKSSVASWMIDIIGDYPIAKNPNRYPIPATAAISHLKIWLQNCDKDHAHLTSDNLSPRLHRIMDRGLLRVINTFNGSIEPLPSSATFVALSYVWGRAVEPHKSLHAMPISEYAPTIRDAAKLAQSLGFEWLWVDRVCIDQNSEVEKLVLIPYIKDIFAAADLTIVAASGDGAHSGLPGSHNTPRQPEISIRIGSREQGQKPLDLLSAPSSFNALYEKCVWRTRGWTFGEQVFSRRLLYVFSSEMIFSCSKGTCRESTGPNFKPEPAGTRWGDSGVTMPIIASELWVQFQSPSYTRLGNMISARQFVRAIEEYTSRGLTIEADRVAAFAGLIAAATDAGDEISERGFLKHGHPLRFFETALTWQHKEEFQGRHIGGPCTVPSWSWASAGTRVHFLDNGEEQYRSNWFVFGILNGFDVLGLPHPAHFIDKRPWLKFVPSNAPPSYEPTTPVYSTSTAPRDLPRLHLLTVIFDAYFGDAEEGQHYISPANDSRTPRIIGSWSMSPLGVDSARRSRTFAIVAGCVSFFIMALQETSEQDVYSRLGLLRISEYGTPLLTIMKCGSSRWHYIRLV
ncbi:heterokaryon incompatibility protein-domain-containing protein [Nemania sp. FL0916]|nr:heterokaryon incompatibility protein-domain-containing protein [Nemania sp. FL0916]